MEKTMIEQLFELQDLSYKEFHAKLIPTIKLVQSNGILLFLQYFLFI
jgi:hypothetical protein